MTIWDNPSTRFHRTGVRLPWPDLEDGIASSEREIECSWHPETILLFMAIASGVLWGGVIAEILYLL